MQQDSSSSPSPQQPPPAGTVGGRLRYANPQDLPSYPSLGLKKSDSAASAAASLGWASQRQQEPHTTRPNRSASSVSASASAAALLAHDNKMPPPAGPSSEPSNASLRAATLAAGGSMSSKRDRPAPPPTLSSNAAASQAFKMDRSPPKPSPRSPPQHQPSEASRRGSILAASGSMSAPSRPRAQSSPVARDQYPDHENAAANARSAATIAHRPSMKASSGDVGAVPYTTLPRSMFTAAPPVKPETDEQKNNDKIHADALAMARKIYTQQQAMFDAAKKTPGSDSSNAASPGVTSLQDTAYKLAQKRLSDMEGDGPRKSKDYQSYYGAASPASRRFAGQRVLRRRASSDTDVVMQDREQSDKIRRQMSIFNHNVSAVDEKKRGEDRQALLALAQKNVQAQLGRMDSKITNETGWVPPSSKSEWELKAQAAARARSDERAGVSHKGQVDIGGGKYMDMKDVEEIASRRMKPVIDDINEKAEKERERLEKLKAEEEARKKGEAERKAKEKEEKEAAKKQRDQEKAEERERKNAEKQQERERKEKEKQEERARREQHKQEERQRKEEERAARHEQRRQAKEEKRRSKELAAAAKALKRQQDAQAPEGGGSGDLTDSDASSVLSSRPSTPKSSGSHQHQHVGSPKSPSQGNGNLKTWLKTRLRGRSNASNTTDQGGEGLGSGSDSRPSTRDGSGAHGFIGGAALAGYGQGRSAQSLSGRNDSTRDIRLAGKEKGKEPSYQHQQQQQLSTPQFLGEGESEIPVTNDKVGDNRPVSPLSSSSDDLGDDAGGRRSRGGSTVSGLSPWPEDDSVPAQNPLGAHPTVGISKVSSKSGLPRDSRFQEMMDQ